MESDAQRCRAEGGGQNACQHLSAGKFLHAMPPGESVAQGNKFYILNKGDFADPK
jgi:hypothetical protein